MQFKSSLSNEQSEQNNKQSTSEQSELKTSSLYSAPKKTPGFKQYQLPTWPPDSSLPLRGPLDERESAIPSHPKVYV